MGETIGWRWPESPYGDRLNEDKSPFAERFSSRQKGFFGVEKLFYRGSLRFSS